MLQCSSLQSPRPLCLHHSHAHRTADLQQVNISLRLLSRPIDIKLKEIFRTLGSDYDERVLPSIGNEVLKAVVVRSGERCIDTHVTRLDSTSCPSI